MNVCLASLRVVLICPIITAMSKPVCVPSGLASVARSISRPWCVSSACSTATSSYSSVCCRSRATVESASKDTELDSGPCVKENRNVWPPSAAYFDSATSGITMLLRSSEMCAATLSKPVMGTRSPTAGLRTTPSVPSSGWNVNRGTVMVWAPTSTTMRSIPGVVEARSASSSITEL